MAKKKAVLKDRRRVSSQRLAEIAGLAHKLWFGFASRKKKNFLATGELFEDTPFKFNSQAEEFFNYCVEKTLNVKGGTVLLTKLSKLPNKKSAPSWLYHREWRVAWVVLDPSQVSRKIKGHQERKKITTRLILHEAGHVVLHLLQLRETKNPGISPTTIAGSLRGVPSVNEAQEEEAWIFCGIVLGLALGQLARRSRPNHLDRAWPRSC